MADASEKVEFARITSTVVSSYREGVPIKQDLDKPKLLDQVRSVMRTGFVRQPPASQTFARAPVRSLSRASFPAPWRKPAENQFDDGRRHRAGCQDRGHCPAS